MNIHPIEFASPEYDEAIRLRYAILRKPIGLDFSPEFLAVEWDNFHIAAFDENYSMVGYLNLTPINSGEVKMRQVAVSENVQNQGVGTAMVAFSEEFSREKGFQKMVLNARETAVSFYLKLGYAKVGERFEEVTIPHFRMEKALT